MEPNGFESSRFFWLLLLMLSAAFPVDPGHATGRPFRIGALTTSWGPTPMIAGLRDGLLELGYRETEDFEIGVRFTRGDYSTLPLAARQLVQHGVDLIFVGRAEAARAAKAATREIPIVFAAVSDPVGAGLIDRFARPGDNITGVSDLGHELGGKRLAIYRELLPEMKRVLFPYDATYPGHKVELEVYGAAARRVGVELLERPFRTEAEAELGLDQIQKGKVDGLLAPRCCLLNIPGLVLRFASQKALPTMFRQAFWVENGGLASYGPDYYASGLQAARLVDKILNGAKPAAIPAEVNTRIEFAINRKVGRALDINIPAEMWFKADRVIR